MNKTTALVLFTLLLVSLAVDAFCGNGACDGAETCATCAFDCGVCSDECRKTNDCCPVGRRSVNGRKPCTACGEGTFSAEPGATTCDRCPVGTFGDGRRSGARLGGCTSCPSGATTAVAGAINENQCFPAPGHWRQTSQWRDLEVEAQNATRADGELLYRFAENILQCTPPEACLGQREDVCTFSIADNADESTRGLGLYMPAACDKRCATGYEGPDKASVQYYHPLGCRMTFESVGNRLCGRCTQPRVGASVAQGFYRNSGRCVRCTATDVPALGLDPWWAFFVYFVRNPGHVGWVLGFGLFLMLGMLNLLQLAKSAGKFGALSISWSFFQVTETFISQPFNWPTAVSDANFLKIFNFNLEFLQPECLVEPLRDFIWRWVGTLLMPAMPLAFFSVIVLGALARNAFAQTVGRFFVEYLPTKSGRWAVFMDFILREDEEEEEEDKEGEEDDGTSEPKDEPTKPSVWRTWWKTLFPEEKQEEEVELATPVAPSPTESPTEETEPTPTPVVKPSFWNILENPPPPPHHHAPHNPRVSQVPINPVGPEGDGKVCARVDQRVPPLSRHVVHYAVRQGV